MTSLCLTRQVPASHDKSPPRMRSLRLSRQVSASHDKFGSDWRVGPDAQQKLTARSTTTDARGGKIPHALQVQQLAAMQAAHPDKSLNSGLTG
jgi:hypothetical protein